MDFVDAAFLREEGPTGFGFQVQRLLPLLGFRDVVNIDGTGDKGGDLIATLNGQRWVFQAKWKKGDLVAPDGVEEVWTAMQHYGIDRGVVVTNTGFSKSAIRRKIELHAAGPQISLWTGADLRRLFHKGKPFPARFNLYDYQRRAVSKAWSQLEDQGKALIYLATGLGKTVVAGNLIQQFLIRKPDAKVLVVAHTADLVAQLEASMWRDFPKFVPTTRIHGQAKPDSLVGVVFGVLPTAEGYIQGGYHPDLIVVDEAHHAGETGHYSRIFEKLPDTWRIGVTATPWRGDNFSIEHYFGEPVAEVSISEGMRLGYLSDVKYRLFSDNIDWDFVEAASEHGYSIRDLNRRLFIPERDDAILDHLDEVWADTKSPRAIVFCQTVEHAERMATQLNRRAQWGGSTAVHAGLGKRERQSRLLNFRAGHIPVITSVDLLNEGVDVPDVNILCFARVTHSRRIFVQQLGRGLRIREGKSHVEVLDFVSDIRRIAEVMNIRAQLAENDVESVSVPRNEFIFDDAKVESLLSQWINDVGDLAGAHESVRLDFPPTEGV